MAMVVVSPVVDVEFPAETESALTVDASVAADIRENSAMNVSKHRHCTLHLYTYTSTCKIFINLKITEISYLP